MPIDEQPAAGAAVAEKSGLRRFVEFPLVAMVLGGFAVIASLILAEILTAVIGLITGDLSLQDRSTFQHMPKWLYSMSGLFTALFAVLALKLVVRRLGEAPRDDLPLGAPAGDFFKGLALAFVLMSAIVGIAALLGGYQVSGWGGSTSWASLIMIGGFHAAFFEEILFRGVIYRFLEEFFGSWPTLLLSGLIFGLVHYNNPNGTLFASLAIAIEAGMLLGAAYLLTRNLWLAIGIHWSWNVTQGYVWDVPVSGIEVDGLLNAHPAGNVLISGGAFGLEASVITMVLATSVGGFLVWLAIRRGHLVQPWWVRRREGVALPA